MVAAIRSTAVLFNMMSPIVITLAGFLISFCAGQSATVIVSGGDQSSAPGQAYVVVGDNLGSYSGQQQVQSVGQTGYIRGQQYQVVSADNLYGSSSQGGASSNIRSVYVGDVAGSDPSSSSAVLLPAAAQPASDVQLNEVQSVSVDLLPAGYQQLSASYGGALGSGSSSGSDTQSAAQSSQATYAGLNLAALGIEPSSYLSGRDSAATVAAVLATSKPAGASQSAGTGANKYSSAKRSGGSRRTASAQDDDEQEPEDDDDDAAVADDQQNEEDQADNLGNLEEANYESVTTRVGNTEAKSAHRRRRRRKVKPKVIIVKKVLPLSTTTYRG